MSRIGRTPITLTAGVSAKIEGKKVTITGPIGTLSQEVDNCIKVEIKDNVIHLTRNSEENEVKAKHGLYRALINNMVNGVVKPYAKKLIINGVGFKATKVGQKLVLNLGFSHPVELTPEQGINIECPSITEIVVSGINKEKVGQFAAQVRDLKKVEPYHGYGIRYSDEVVVKKEGKTSGKGKK
ncbi:MAG: 50S ribosomal protein L6 [Clostridia bacterium]